MNRKAKIRRAILSGLSSNVNYEPVEDLFQYVGGYLKREFAEPLNMSEFVAELISLSSVIEVKSTGVALR